MENLEAVVDASGFIEFLETHVRTDQLTVLKTIMSLDTKVTEIARLLNQHKEEFPCSYGINLAMIFLAINNLADVKGSKIKDEKDLEFRKLLMDIIDVAAKLFETISMEKIREFQAKNLKEKDS